MAQLPCIGLYKPCINLPFGYCAMYFDHGVLRVEITSMYISYLGLYRGLYKIPSYIGVCLK